MKVSIANRTICLGPSQLFSWGLGTVDGQLCSIAGYCLSFHAWLALVCSELVNSP